MKKVLLSAVVAIAIVGGVAAKVNTRAQSFWYKTPNVGCTLKSDFPDGTCNGSGSNCTATVDGETADLYTAANCPTSAHALKN